jgi:hypothetical protein
MPLGQPSSSLPVSSATQAPSRIWPSASTLHVVLEPGGRRHEDGGEQLARPGAGAPRRGDEAVERQGADAALAGELHGGAGRQQHREEVAVRQRAHDVAADRRLRADQRRPEAVRGPREAGQGWTHRRSA